MATKIDLDDSDEKRIDVIHWNWLVVIIPKYDIIIKLEEKGKEFIYLSEEKGKQISMSIQRIWCAVIHMRKWNGKQMKYRKIREKTQKYLCFE